MVWHRVGGRLRRASKVQHHSKKNSQTTKHRLSNSTASVLARTSKAWELFQASLKTEFIAQYGDEVVDDKHEYNPTVSRNFITYYVNTRPKANKHHIGEATNFLQRRLRDHRGPTRPTPSGTVSGDDWVTDKRKAFAKALSERVLSDLTRDVQAHPDNIYDSDATVPLPSDYDSNE
jgi:hypothetical protein